MGSALKVLVGGFMVIGLLGVFVAIQSPTVPVVAPIAVTTPAVSKDHWILEYVPTGQVIGTFAYKSQCIEVHEKLARDAILHFRNDAYSKLEVDTLSEVACRWH